MTQRHLRLKDREIQLEPSHEKIHLIFPQNSWFVKSHYNDVGLEILHGLQQVDLW